MLQALDLPRSVVWTQPIKSPSEHAESRLAGMALPPPKAVGTPAERGLRFESEHPYGLPEPYAWKVRMRHPDTGEKAITWESLNPTGERVPGLLGRRQADLPLYRENELGMAKAADEYVLLCESESSVDALNKAGWYSTTWPGGAGDPPVERIREVFGDYRRGILIPDHDEAGLRCADRLARGGAIRNVLRTRPGEDARDLLARLGPDEFRASVERDARSLPKPPPPVPQQRTPDTGTHRSRGPEPQPPLEQRPRPAASLARAREACAAAAAQEEPAQWALADDQRTDGAARVRGR